MVSTLFKCPDAARSGNGVSDSSSRGHFVEEPKHTDNDIGFRGFPSDGLNIVKITLDDLDLAEGAGDNLSLGAVAH